MFRFAAAMLLATIPSVAVAVDATTVVKVGDTVPGMGTITDLDQHAVGGDGSWLVVVDTDFSSSLSDEALLGDQGVVMREGDAFPAVPGSTILAVQRPDIDSMGNWSAYAFLDGIAFQRNEVILYNGDVVVREEDPITTPGVPAGARWGGFTRHHVNDLGQIIAIGEYKVPSPFAVVRCIALFTPNGSGWTGRVLIEEGDVLPGQTGPLVEAQWAPEESAFNSTGKFLWLADLEPGSLPGDDALYLNGRLLEQEGLPAPASGRTWTSFNDASEKLGLNDSGSWLFVGRSDGSFTDNELVTLNGDLVLRSGEAVPGVPGAVWTGFGSGSANLGNNGNWILHGRSDAFPDNGFLLVRGNPVLRDGDFLDGGRLLHELWFARDNLDTDPSGRFVLTRAQTKATSLSSDVESLVLVDLADQVSVSFPVPGTAGVPSDLEVEHGTPGHDVTLFGGLPGVSSFSCGGTQLTLAMGTRSLLGTATLDETGSAAFTATIPRNARGRTVRFQAVDLDACVVGPARSVPVP